MAALEATSSLFPIHRSPPPSSSSLKFRFSFKFHPLHSSLSLSSISLKAPRSPFTILPKCSHYRMTGFKICSALQEVSVEQSLGGEQETHQKSKLFVANLPWSLSSTDLEKLFSECGTVRDIEIIKQKDGKSRGFAFVAMASEDEAQAIVDKFNSFELSGRIIKVEFAKHFNKPSPPPPVQPPPVVTHHKLFVSNLAWKVRSSHLREFFSANFSPVSARVVFDAPLGGSTGYGFVAFATKEEADAVISAFDGKELMGRPIRLKFARNVVDEPGDKKEEENISGEQPETL